MKKQSFQLISNYASSFAVVALIASFSACSSIEKAKDKEPNGFTIEYNRDSKTKLKEGAYTRFYESGKKYQEGNFHKDSLDGEIRYFYESGVLQTVEHYKTGSYEGVYKAFFEDGKLEQEGQYLNNEMSGEWKTYYKDGTLKENVSFAHNMENGPFKEFYPDGKIKAEGAYFDGENENGELKEYHVSGELMRIAQCEKGVCRTTWAADTTKFINRN